jgi:hypothetical protein
MHYIIFINKIILSNGIVILQFKSTKYQCQQHDRKSTVYKVKFVGYFPQKKRFFLAWTKIFQWLSGFITFSLEMKQFHLFIFFRFLSILFHQTAVTERLYFIVDTYVKSRENRNTNIGHIKAANTSKNYVLVNFVPYWQCCTICITKAVFILFMSI